MSKKEVASSEEDSVDIDEIGQEQDVSAVESTDEENLDVQGGGDIEEDESAGETTTDSELEAAKAQAAEYLDRMTRVQAEMENLRKRTARDVQNARKFALESFARELLAVADSIDLGLVAARDSDDVLTILEGMELTSKQLFGVLEKFNIEVMDAQGVRFDPEQHEAMTMVPNPDMEPNTVMDVVQKGYTLNERLLRPARVIVSS